MNLHSPSSPKSLAALLLALSFTAAACAGSDSAIEAEAGASESEETAETAMDDETMDEEAMDDDMHEDMDDDMSDDMSDDMDDDMDDDMMLAAWQTLELVDVDGETFTLADYVGTTVFVENFATWCPTCRGQLTTTNEAAGQLTDVAFIALSTETDLSAADVAAYADENGFDNIRFAVMTPEFLAAMADAYGNSAVNPPSTPHFFIDAMGHPGELVTGTESAEEIAASVPGA